MKSLPHPAWIEINLQQFKCNIAAIRQHIGSSLLCLPIKANAYGHGLVAMAHAAVAAGVDYLAVSCLQEGALLREADINIPIFVMGAIHEEQIPDLLNYQFDLTISSLYKAELVAKICKQLQKRCRVHVEIETGMQRTGVRPETAIKLLNYLGSESCFEIMGLYSHMATADIADNEHSYLQIKSFQQFTQQIIPKQPKRPICHLANSGGVCYYPDAYMDMVRPGLLALGYFQSQIGNSLAAISPFFSIKAKIAYFKVVEAGQGIGYGRSYITSQRTRIVTVPVGYGDGYLRALSNRGRVLIRGQFYPIVGMICMDQFMVDIGNDEAYVGDEVVLIGKQGDKEISLLELAKLCNTIPYEILCLFNDRLPRVYLS
ncbi:alanine racemase [soil metagenome]